LHDPERLNKIAELLGRAGVDPDNIQHIRRTNIYQMGYKDADGEAQTKDLVSISYIPKPSDPQEIFVPATPARITPTRSKPVQRKHKEIFVFTDPQMGNRNIDGVEHPIHDPRAIAVARLICRDVRPETIINLGDTIDLSSLSRFKPDSNHFMRELGPSFQSVHDMYAGFRSDNPNARIVEVASNHNQRLVDYVLKNFGSMYDVRRPGDNSKYPVMSYPYMANLEHLGVEWIGGWPAGEFIYGAEYDKPPIVFRHGTENSQNGTTAAKIMKNHPETHNVQGHDHTIGEAWHTLRDGTPLGTFVVGALCRTTGEVPSYHSAVGDDNKPVHHQENWQQSVMVIRDFKNGRYEFIQIPIVEGVAYYNGKEYRVE
jgi:hypothetical protein